MKIYIWNKLVFSFFFTYAHTQVSLTLTFYIGCGWQILILEIMTQNHHQYVINQESLLLDPKKTVITLDKSQTEKLKRIKM